MTLRCNNPHHVMTVVIWVVAGLSLLCVSSASAATHGDCNGRLAFDSRRAPTPPETIPSRHIYALDAPATETGAPIPSGAPTQLTSGLGNDAKPSWAPPSVDFCPVTAQANRIAFQRTETVSGVTGTHIYTTVVPAAGQPPPGAAQALTAGSGRDTAPAWAPHEITGAEVPPPAGPAPPIAFERSAGGPRDLYIISPAG